MYIFLKNYWKSIVYICFLVYVSLIRIPAVPSLPKITGSDKIVHFGLYCILAVLLYIDFKRGKERVSLFGALMLSVVFSICLGGAIEILQGTYFPPRTAEWADFVSDIIGAVVGFAAAYLFFNKKKKNIINKK